MNTAGAYQLKDSGTENLVWYIRKNVLNYVLHHIADFSCQA